MEAKLQEILDQLTLEEKLRLISGDGWSTHGVPRLGIPSLKTTDGPSGARGSTFYKGTKSAFLPCSTSIAATFDAEAAFTVGRILGKQASVKNCEIVLAPTVCIHRSPLGGRNFEAFSEDPFLTGVLGSEYVKGVQSNDKVYATVKHFVANEQETRRFNVNNIIPERALREIYLRPFEMIVKQSHPGCVMTSYNLINGTHADMNEWLLQSVLRDEWGFKGTVMSDWGGTNSVAGSIKAGLDLEMPNRAQRLFDLVSRSLDSAELKESDIDHRVLQMLHMIFELRELGAPDRLEEGEDDDPRDRDDLLHVASDGVVLLKNDGGLLPVQPGPRSPSIAVIGRHAKYPVAGGGGSADLNPYYVSTPLEALQKEFGTVSYAECTYFPKHVPFPEPQNFQSNNNRRGYSTIEYFEHSDVGMVHPVKVYEQEGTNIELSADSLEERLRHECRIRMSGIITAQESGNHRVGLVNVGKAKLYIEDEMVLDNTEWTKRSDRFFSLGSQEVQAKYRMEAKRPYRFRIDYLSTTPEVDDDNTLFSSHIGLRFGFEEETKTDFSEQAGQIARNHDVVLVFVGQDNDWESEGCDRKSISLPGNQNEVIDAVAKANKQCVVVNQSGSPIEMPWVDRVAAVLQAWYQGQENGNAIAQIITGKTNPSGKLPVTFPKKLQDTPSYHCFPGANDLCEYKEGVFVGYRHNLAKQVDPLFSLRIWAVLHDL